MAQGKYIAAGFVSDAEKLLGDFIQENSTEFAVFAKKWRKWNFSFIYMGRANERELKEFTQEIFYLSSRFLYSSSLLYQVGGIYLLYALFRNQILVPPVRIRLILNQWKSIKAMRELFAVKEHSSLHYVINYLIENSLDYVGCPSLMGPVLTNLAESRKVYESGYAPKSPYVSKVGLIELVESNILTDIDKLCKEYTESKLLLKIPGMNAETSFRFDEFDKRLNNLLGRHESLQNAISSSNVAEMQASGSEELPSSMSNIGSRRTNLKSKATKVIKSSRRYRNSRTKAANDKNCDLNSVPDESVVADPNYSEHNKKGKKSVRQQQSGYKRRRVRKRQGYSITRHYYKEHGRECDDLKMVSNYESLKFASQHENVFFSDSDEKEAVHLNVNSPCDEPGGDFSNNYELKYSPEIYDASLSPQSKDVEDNLPENGKLDQENEDWLFGDPIEEHFSDNQDVSNSPEIYGEVLSPQSKDLDNLPGNKKLDQENEDWLFADPIDDSENQDVKHSSEIDEYTAPQSIDVGNLSDNLEVMCLPEDKVTVLSCD